MVESIYTWGYGYNMLKPEFLFHKHSIHGYQWKAYWLPTVQVVGHNPHLHGLAAVWPLLHAMTSISSAASCAPRSSCSPWGHWRSWAQRITSLNAVPNSPGNLPTCGRSGFLGWKLTSSTVARLAIDPKKSRGVASEKVDFTYRTSADFDWGEWWFTDGLRIFFEGTWRFNWRTCFYVKLGRLFSWVLADSSLPT